MPLCASWLAEEGAMSMPRTEIKVTGFGGQGVVLAGIIVARAACLHDAKNATQTQSYGPEARGGAARSEVVISDGPIDYPKVEQADILVAMSQEALDRHLGTLREGGVLLVDEDLVRDIPEGRKAVLYRVPATRVASEELGRRIVANMVMLGAFARATEVIDLASIEKVIRERFSSSTVDINLAAITRTYQITNLEKSG